MNCLAVQGNFPAVMYLKSSLSFDMARITQEKIDGMFDAYLEKQTAVHIAETTGVHLNTANKYVNKGDPERGVQAFKTRFEEGRKKQEEVADSKSEFYKKEDLEIVQNIKKKMWDALKRLDGFNESTISLNQFVDAMERLAKLQQFLCGEAETITRHEHINTIKLDLPPEVVNSISRIVLTHYQEIADEKAIEARLLENGEPSNEVVDAEFSESGGEQVVTNNTGDPAGSSPITVPV